MKKEHIRSRELGAFARLLDGYGADRTRWPAPERLRFASLLAEDAEARRLLAEAAALDRLIDMAPLVAESRREALVERILERAASEASGQAGAPARAPAGPSGRTGPASFVRSWTSARSARVLVRWPAAMLMAASLLVGIFAGTTRTVERVITPWTVAVGLRSVDGDPLRMALGEEIGGAGVEELL